MGLFREHLINVLACLVAIDLSIGAVVIYDRNRQVSTTVSAGAPDPTPVRPATSQSPQAPPTSVVNAPQSVATAPPLPSTTSSPPTRPPAVSAEGSIQSRSRQRTSPASGRGTTTSTSRPAGVATPAQPAPTGTTGQPATPADGTGSPSDAPPPDASTGSSAPPKTTPPSTTTSGVWTVTADPTGDTIVDSSQAPQATPRADVVESRATNTTKGIGFAVKVADPVEPARDPTWNSAATFVLWEIDTNGDDKADFEVEYFLEGGKLIAGVSRLTANGRQAACEAEAQYMSESYAVGIDPACLGSPASLSYRATVFYAVGSNNDDSITDVSPDGGMSAPLRRTAP